MRKLTAFAIAGLAAFASYSAIEAQNAPTVQPGAMDAGRVQAGTYKTDKNHSLIGFRYNHHGFNDYFGLFGNVDATLTIDPANLGAAKVEAFIPIEPTVTSSAFREHLLRPGADGNKPDFFGPDQAPAHFISHSVQVTGTKAMIHGNFTLNGVTKPLMIEAEFTGAGDSTRGVPTIGFEGTTSVLRSDFGLGGAVPLVDDKVDLTLTMAFEKQ